VLSRFFVDAGGHDGVERDFTVLAREAVVGRIEFVQPYMARVVLLSDPDCRTAVRVGRIRGGRFVAVDYPATLRGRGRGEMVIEDVLQRNVSTDGKPGGDDQIAIGDLVVTAPDTPGLSGPMTIGRVVSINSDPKKRLVYAVMVEPAAKPDDLSDVYIVAGLSGRDDLSGP
jgi:cell shape-determining protein MreC